MPPQRFWLLHTSCVPANTAEMSSKPQSLFKCFTMPDWPGREPSPCLQIEELAVVCIQGLQLINTEPARSWGPGSSSQEM